MRIQKVKHQRKWEVVLYSEAAPRLITKSLFKDYVAHQFTRISGSKWVKPRSSKFRTTGTARTK